MNTDRNELRGIVSRWMHGGYTPNPSDKIIRVVDAAPALTEFLTSIQRQGADMARWTEAEWLDVIIGEFGVDEDHAADYLEEVATWGAVDDDLWTD